MQRENKRLIKNTLLLYIRMFFIMGIGLFTSRVILNSLGVEDFGIYNIVGGTVALFSFLNVTLSGAASRFLSFDIGRNNQESLTQTFRTTIAVHIIIALAIVLLAETLGLWFLYNQINIPDGKFSAALFVYHISILTSIISILQVPFTASIISHEDMGVYSYVSILEAVSKLATAYIILTIGSHKLEIYASLIAAVALLLFIIYVCICVRKYPECILKPKFNLQILKPIIKYSCWDLYGNLSAMARTYGIAVVLNMFFGAVINAATGIATQVQNAVMGFVENFMTAARPQIVKYYAAQRFQDMTTLIYNASKYSFILIFLVSFPIIVECSYILRLWLGVVPDYAVPFTQFCLIMGWNSALFRPIGFGIHSTGKIKSMSFVNGTIILCIIPLSYIAFKNGCSPTTAYAFNITLLLLSSTFNTFLLQRLVPEFSSRMFLKHVLVEILKIVLPTSIMIFFLVSKIEQGPIRLILTLLCSTILVLTTAWVWVTDKNTKEKIVLTIKSKLKCQKK